MALWQGALPNRDRSGTSLGSQANPPIAARAAEIGMETEASTIVVARADGKRLRPDRPTRVSRADRL